MYDMQTLDEPDSVLLLLLRRQYKKIHNDLMQRTIKGNMVNPKEWANLTHTREMIYDTLGMTHVMLGMDNLILNATPSIDPDTGLLQHDPYQRVAWWDKKHGGSGKKPRKIRKRKLKRDEPKERWIIDGAQDELCLRYENTIWPVGAGPYPESDTHPNCKCKRIQYRARKSDGDIFK